jgi:uncharacterized membrane protein
MARSLDEARAHTPKLVLLSHAQAIVHGTTAVGRFNNWVAVKITNIVGSMWCAYAFVLLTLISLPAAIKSGDPLIIVSWIAQTFLQLVLLPIIIVGQNVQAAASEARAQADHETLSAIHSLSSVIHKIDEQQMTILTLLAERSEK